MRISLMTLGLVAALALDGSAFAATELPSKVLGLMPHDDHACVAVPIPLDANQSLAGITWYHNDAGSAFPHLLLMEGTPGIAPDLTQTGMILDELSGDDLAWRDVYLEFPVVSSTNFIYAVFVFPPDDETTAMGSGGGPAIGLRDQDVDLPFMISGDGVEWASFAQDTELAVDPIYGGLAKGTQSAMELGALAGSVHYEGAPEGDDDTPVVIIKTRLHAPAPNPFNPSTKIVYDLVSPAMVSLRVFDVRGRLVRKLVDGEQIAGRHVMRWLGTDDNGARVSSGVYFLRFSSPGLGQTEKVVLVK